MERTDEGAVLLTELAKAPLAHNIQFLAAVFRDEVCIGFDARQKPCVRVTHHDRASQGAQEVHGLARLRSTLDHVAITDDLVKTGLLEVLQDSLERQTVSVDI